MGRYRFGNASLIKLVGCHPLLHDALDEAMLRTPMDFVVLEGFRNKADQDAAVRRGASKQAWPTSKHNHTENDRPCSLAVDVAPWYADAPHVRWDRTAEFRWLAGFIQGASAYIVEPKGFRLRWGGDWDGDGDHGDSSFIDLPHLELVPL